MKILQFSGGKDSLACLHLFKDEDIVVVHVDTGAELPFMRDFIRKSVEDVGLPLKVVSPATPCDQWQEENGYPADVVSWNHTPMMAQYSGNTGPFVVPYSTCCTVNLWQPMLDEIKRLGADTVIRGSKACDPKKSVCGGHEVDGVTHLTPLWDWTDQNVRDYLTALSVDLPPQYAEGCDSFDCWCCTAYLADHGKQRFDYLANHYSDLHADAAQRLECVMETARTALEGMRF